MWVKADIITLGLQSLKHADCSRNRTDQAIIHKPVYT